MQKYLIISDIHDNLANLAVLAQKEPLENLSGLIVAGDVCAWDTVLEMQRLFPVSTWLVAGNGDYDWPSNYYDLKPKTQNLEPTKYFKRPFIFQINNYHIGLAHEPKQAKKLWKQNPNLGYIIFGHTHWPTTEIWGATIALNPGNLAGLRTPATYATLDFATTPPFFQLHRLF